MQNFDPGSFSAAHAGHGIFEPLWWLVGEIVGDRWSG
jgi:hypothetical protein